MFGSSTSRTCAKSSGFNKRGAAGGVLAAHVTKAVASTKRMSPKNRTRFICGMAMPGQRASIPNSGNQFWQGHTAIGREPVVKIKKPSGIVRFSADFAKAFGVRRTCREWSELGSRDIGGKTRRMRVRARTALGSELLELGPLLANVRSWALGSPQFPLLKTPAACSRTVTELLRIRYGSLSASGRSTPALHFPIAPFGRTRRDEAPCSELYISHVPLQLRMILRVLRLKNATMRQPNVKDEWVMRIE